MKRILLTLLVALAVLCAPAVAAQQKYAVLISTGETLVDDDNYHSEYWYDLMMMYRMLIARGFTHDDIFVLYGDGSDFLSAHPEYNTATHFPAVAQITDFPTTKANVQNLFAWLAAGDAAHSIPQIQPGDFLFVWWMGHGGWPGDDASGNHLYSAAISTTGESMSDAEFAAAFALLPRCVIKNVNVMTCHSGALLDDIQAVDIAAHTSSRYDQSSYSSAFDVWHADFSYQIGSAFWEQTPDGVAVASDANGNGAVCVKEANTWAHAHVASSETVVGDYRGMAHLVEIETPTPASAVPVTFAYSRDYAEDDGTVPSNVHGIAWYEGPDLWVRWTDDGLTAPQDPEFGQSNYVYARVHNIGCTPVDVTANVSWSETTAWASPASWHLIHTLNVPGLAPGESRRVSTEWATVPIPGKYCLHTTLDAAGDPANADGRAFMDNNKVQLNVTVHDNVPGWTKVTEWFLENGLEKDAVVDLTIQNLTGRIPAGTAVAKVTLPPDVRFSAIRGAKFRRSAAGTVIDVPLSGTVVVEKIPLKPREKKEALLAVTLPRAMAFGKSVAIRVAELVDGREMGGILFHTRSADVATVVAQTRRRTEAVLKALSRDFPSEKATQLERFFADTRRLDLQDPQGRLALMRAAAQHAQALRVDWERTLAAGEPARVTGAVDEFTRASERADLAAFVAAQDALASSVRPHFRKVLETGGGSR